MFEQTAREFGESRILPSREELIVLNKDLSLSIFKEMGELGFLGVDVAEEYGGLFGERISEVEHYQYKIVDGGETTVVKSLVW